MSSLLISNLLLYSYITQYLHQQNPAETQDQMDLPSTRSFQPHIFGATLPSDYSQLLAFGFSASTVLDFDVEVHGDIRAIDFEAVLVGALEAAVDLLCSTAVLLVHVLLGGGGFVLGDQLIKLRDAVLELVHHLLEALVGPAAHLVEGLPVCHFQVVVGFRVVHRHHRDHQWVPEDGRDHGPLQFLDAS